MVRVISTAYLTEREHDFLRSEDPDRLGSSTLIIRTGGAKPPKRPKKSHRKKK